MVILTQDDVLATAQALLDKKARDVVLLEVGKIVAYTDFFLIATGRSTTQVKALADAAAEYLKNKGTTPLHIEGYAEGRWVLLDYDELIVHIFLEEARFFYDLERLWRDVPRIDVVDETPSSDPARQHAH